MNKKDNYKIPFVGLSLGVHNYEFSFDNKFFESFEADELLHSDIKVNVKLEKQTTLLQLDCTYNGIIKIICDRCGDEMDLNMNNNSKIIFKLHGESYQEIDDDVIILSANDYEIDLKNYFFEIIYLSLPQKRTHASLELCNKDAIKKLETLTIKENTADPRWEALRKIK